MGAGSIALETGWRHARWTIQSCWLRFVAGSEVLQSRISPSPVLSFRIRERTMEKRATGLNQEVGISVRGAQRIDRSDPKKISP